MQYRNFDNSAQNVEFHLCIPINVVFEKNRPPEAIFGPAGGLLLPEGRIFSEIFVNMLFFVCDSTKLRFAYFILLYDMV